MTDKDIKRDLSDEELRELRSRRIDALVVQPGFRLEPVPQDAALLAAKIEAYVAAHPGVRISIAKK